jgi:hypothetical protein
MKIMLNRSPGSLIFLGVLGALAVQSFRERSCDNGSCVG